MTAVALPSLALLASSATTISLAAGKNDKPFHVAVRIEILPGEHEKWIDPILAEPVPVAVLGEPGMDVRAIDPASLVLAGAAVTKAVDGSLASYGDVNGDGVADLLVSFPSRSMHLKGPARASLTGATVDGRAILGWGAVATPDQGRAERRAQGRPPADVEKLSPILAAIDVLPGVPDNLIELGNRGTVEVALLSAPGFDATRIDPLSLHLAGAPVTRRRGGGLASFRDVNGDRRDDLIVEVPKKLLQLDAGARQAVLTGITPDGRFLTASGAISIAETATLTFDSEDAVAPRAPTSVEFSNSSAISINDLAPASPYPSQINVAGLLGVVSKVRVTLKGLSHTYLDDIDVLLVGPTGQSLLLMSDVGGFNPGATNITLTFDDDVALALDPSVIPGTGTYRPTNDGPGDVFAGPAPSPSGGTALGVFNGTNPNGTWSLYVVDDTLADVGTIAGGWSVDFVLASEFCSAGPITINDAAPAAPYPSSIAVAGLTGVVSKVTAVLKGFTHTFPPDVDVLLVAPNGETSLLVSDVGGSPGVAGVTLALDDNAPLLLDAALSPGSGTYKPADFAPADVFPAPAPGESSIPSLFHHAASNPNGTWSLYVVDDTAGNVGTLTSFCLRITTIPPVDTDNPATITIPAGAPGSTAGAANPYPSTIEVSGVLGTIVKATVTLRGVTHTYPADLDVLLQSPWASVLLMSDVGGTGPGVAGVTYTFDDDAAGSMPLFSNPPAGTYRPSNSDADGPDVLPGPAPAGPYGSTLGEVILTPSNGTWRLYVFDDAGGDVGSVSFGWTLTLRTWLRTSHRCNTITFGIPDGAPGNTQGPAQLYPSGIIHNPDPLYMDQYKVRVTLSGLNHTFPQDLDILLVGPQGQNVLLMSDAGGGAPGASAVILNFDDDALAGLPLTTNPVFGIYRPTNFDPGDVLPPPAPPPPYGDRLSVFKGTSPVGAWGLYVFDDDLVDVGSLGGWCLDFVPSITADEVPNLRFTDKTTTTWDGGPNATSYNLYRGGPGQLVSLADATADGCLRGNTLTQQFTGLTETPAAGSFYWYLVRGNNAQGEGFPGLMSLAGQLRARIQDSSGSCP